MHRIFLVLCFSLASANADVIRLAGASSIARPLAAATKILEPQIGGDVQILTQGGGDGGLESLGLHRVDVAMVVSKLSGSERAKYPDVLFTPTFIGRQAIAVAVSDELWQAGVRKLTREQMRKIYQKRIKNWKDVGGPDRPISFFDWSPESGTWQMFGQWLYGDSRRTPQGKFPVVNDAAGALQALADHPSAAALVPLYSVDGKKVHALSLPDKSENLVEPTLVNVAKGIYPINRPLFLVTDDRPTGGVKEIFAFILGPRGEELMHDEGYYSAAELKALGDPNAQ